MGILILLLNIIAMALMFHWYIEFGNTIYIISGLFNLFVIDYMLYNIDDLLD